MLQSYIKEPIGTP